MNKAKATAYIGMEAVQDDRKSQCSDSGEEITQ